MNFPTLYKKTSTDAIQQWSIEVVPTLELDPRERIAKIVTTYGKQGGKMQTAFDIITEGKNTDKANATTPVEQAEAEAKSQWEKKKKKGYVETIAEAQADKVDTNSITGGVDPMLAHTYAKQGYKIKWPAFVQPKLDGHRCIAIYQDGKCTLWSRTRKRITGVPHIAREIERTFNGTPVETIILDGELYNHDYKDKFEELSSFIRQTVPKPGHEVVQFYIYDIADETKTFEERNTMLDMVEEMSYDIGDRRTLVFVTTAVADSEEDMTEAFGIFVAEGFEGLMVRNAASPYKGKRSYDLQKVKTFDDAEFEVVDVLEGRGKMAGKAIFECATESGETFTCKMVGALENLKGYLQSKDFWIGQKLTVQYQGLSAKGIPRFPVGLRFREDV